MPPEELERLSDADRADLERRQSDVLHEFRSVMLRQRQIMQQLAEDVRAIERNFGATLIAPLITEIKQRYAQEKVQRYLDAIQEHMLSHLDMFKEVGQPAQAMPTPSPDDGREPFLEYRVNVVVDNSETHGAPVLVEDTPTYKNLFGAIDRVVDPHGRVVTNFTRIKAGSCSVPAGGMCYSTSKTP